MAAEQGYALGQYRIGYMYHKGRGVQQDDAEAVKWFRMAAKQGDADAIAMVDKLYVHGCAFFFFGQACC